MQKALKNPFLAIFSCGQRANVRHAHVHCFWFRGPRQSAHPCTDRTGPPFITTLSNHEATEQYQRHPASAASTALRRCDRPIGFRIHPPSALRPRDSTNSAHPSTSCPPTPDPSPAFVVSCDPTYLWDVRAPIAPVGGRHQYCCSLRLRRRSSSRLVPSQATTETACTVQSSSWTTCSSDSYPRWTGRSVAAPNTAPTALVQRSPPLSHSKHRPRLCNQSTMGSQRLAPAPSQWDARIAGPAPVPEHGCQSVSASPIALPGTFSHKTRASSTSFNVSAIRTRSASAAKVGTNDHDDNGEAEEHETCHQDDCDGDVNEEIDDVCSDGSIEDMIHDMVDATILFSGDDGFAAFTDGRAAPANVAWNGTEENHRRILCLEKSIGSRRRRSPRKGYTCSEKGAGGGYRTTK